MTKGGTGDVLAALIASLYCKNNDPFLVAQAGSYLNKKAGESLFTKVGYYFNASDLVDELPRVMKKYIL
jgi:NAD(P)H-hydrate repair Nnr-like enzyme with NAD(P)H-hydrate dehydratase domain